MMTSLPDDSTGETDGRFLGCIFRVDFPTGQAFGADGNGLTILLQYHNTRLLHCFFIREVNRDAYGAGFKGN